jgi:hypothetical protein
VDLDVWVTPISFCPDPGQDIDTLIKAADHAMYEIKQFGKSGVEFARSQQSHEYKELLYPLLSR